MCQVASYLYARLRVLGAQKLIEGDDKDERLGGNRPGDAGGYL